MSVRVVAAALGAAAAVLACTGAQAAEITQTFYVTASEFTPLYGAPATPAPISPVQLDFSLTFDPDVNTTTPTTAGLTVSAFNLPDPVEWTFSGNNLVIASEPLAGGPGCYNNANTFCLLIQDWATYPGSPVYLIGFTQVTSASGYWAARNVGLAAVPEPTTWALMLVGIGGLGAALRLRGRRKGALAAA